MAEYSVYSFEVQQTTKGLFPLQDGQDALRDANHIIGSLLKSDLCVQGKKEPLTYECLREEQDIYMVEIKNVKTVKRWDGHKAEHNKSYPGSYILVDNRPGVCQICIENNSAFNVKTHEAVTCLTRALQRELDPHGLSITIKQKYSNETFQERVRERMRVDRVKKVNFCISNPKNTVGMDTCGSNVQGLFNMAILSNAAKLRAEFIGPDGGSMFLSEEQQQDFATIATICAQNSYSINYYFWNSDPIRMEDSPGASASIGENLVSEFLAAQTALTFDGAPQSSSYALILRLDEIRKSIAKYTDEKTIDIPANGNL